jgi:integrase/recombinase XerD
MLDQFEVKIHKMGIGFYNCKFKDPKTNKRIRKRFYSLKDAKDFKKTTETKVLSKGVSAFSDLRVSTALESYIKNFPGSSIRNRKNHFKSFVDNFGAFKVNQISSNDLRSWLLKSKEHSDLSDKTLNSIRSQFSGFFKQLVEEDQIKLNPLDRVKFKRNANPKRPRVVLSIDEVKTIISNAKVFSPNLLYPYLSTVAHTGARREEVVSLKRKNIDFENGLIHLVETKNGRERFVKISPLLFEVLKAHLASHSFYDVFVNEQGKKLNSQGELTKLMNKFKAFFPIEKNNWGAHSLRHSFAYNFLKKSGKMYQLQAILGHRSIDVTVDLYGQLQAQDIECPSPYED